MTQPAPPTEPYRVDGRADSLLETVSNAPTGSFHELTGDEARALATRLGIVPLADAEPGGNCPAAYRFDERGGWVHHRGVLPESPDQTSVPEAGQTFLRGLCPDCGGVAVYNEYRNTDRGFLHFRYECWEALRTNGASCQWRAIP